MYSYLLKRLKESDNEQVLTAGIQGLRELHSIFGAEIFSAKDKDFIEKMKNEGPNNYIRDLADNLINELEGRR